MNQHVIEIKVAKSRFRPDESPLALGEFPASAVHRGLDSLLGPRGPVERFDERLLNRIEINRAAPLHAIAGGPPLFAGHRAELHHIETGEHPLWQLIQP